MNLAASRQNRTFVGVGVVHCALFVAITACAHAAPPCRYDMEIVQPPSNCSDGFPAGVTNLILDESGNAGGTSYACAGAFAYINGISINLPSSAGIGSIHVRDIARSSLPGALQVVGQLTQATVGIRPGIWEAGQWTSLPILAGHNMGHCSAINESSVVVGQSMNNATGPLSAAMWVNGNVSQLVLPFGEDATANDINEAGDVVGWMGSANTVDSHAFVRWADGTVVDIGVVPGGYTGEAIAINNQGQILVEGRVGRPGAPATEYRSFIWEAGEFTDLGVLDFGTGPYTSIHANDLSDNGEVVGTAQRITPPGTSGFHWKNGFMRQSAELVPHHPYPFAQVWLPFPRSVNNAGQIAGEGFDSLPPARSFGILLTPVFPIDGDATCDGAVNVSDILAVINSWGACSQADCHADLDDNLAVDVLDLLAVLLNWGNQGRS